MAHKKKQKEDPPTDTSYSSSSEKEEVEISVSEAEEEVESSVSKASEKYDSDSDFVESSKNHKRRRSNAVKKPNSSSSSSKSKSTKIIKKREVGGVERKWSDEDEIVVLEGLRDWKNKGWLSNIAFDEFIDEFRKSLHISIVNKHQMNAKIGRLKERFCKFLEKKSDDGVELVFEDPHDYKMYLIMKDIWGDEDPVIRRRNLKVGDGNGNGNGNGRNVKAKRELLGNSPMLGFKECVSKEGLKLIGDSKVMEFERKWKKLLKEERDLKSKCMELIQETTQAFLAAVESSKD